MKLIYLLSSFSPAKARLISQRWTTKVNGFIKRKKTYFGSFPSYPATGQKNLPIKSGQDKVYQRTRTLYQSSGWATQTVALWDRSWPATSGYYKRVDN